MPSTKTQSTTIYSNISTATPVGATLAVDQPERAGASPALTKDLTFDYSVEDITAFLTGVMPEEAIGDAVETIKFLQERENRGGKGKKAVAIDSSDVLLEKIIEDIPLDHQQAIKEAVRSAMVQVKSQEGDTDIAPTMTIEETDSSVVKTVEIPLKPEREKVELIFLIRSEEDTRIFSPQIMAQKMMQVNVETANISPTHDNGVGEGRGGVETQNLIKTDQIPTLLIPHQYKEQNNAEALVDILEYLCDMYPDVLSFEEVEYYSPDNETAKAIAFKWAF